MLLFSRGDFDSVQKLHECFTKFSTASGLQANLTKSTIYCRGMAHRDRETIVQLIGYSLGKLPFNYLAVPLDTKKLTMVQWQPLLAKIVAKITSWNIKKLSYARRVQLIQTVLFGIQSYWAQLFTLPAKVIQIVEAHCRCYLWSRGSSITKKYLIDGEKICLPKSIGGLNLYNLQVWNNVAIAKTHADLTHNRDKLWIKWIYAYYIKE